MKKVSLFLIPLTLFILLSVFLFKGLFSNPRELDSSLMNKPLPPFALPDLMSPDVTYTPELFKGQVTLMNVWGVWCVTCAIELPFLTQLSDQGVRIVGLYYDQDIDPDFGIKSIPSIQKEVRAKLAQLGNPYEVNIFDVKRDYSLDLGVTGAPETYVIDKDGVVRMHHIGDINPRVWRGKIEPLYKQLVAE